MNSSGMPLASRFLWVLTALFIGSGIAYSVLTPVFENSDETLHYPYVKHLADGQGLPLARPGQLWNQEGTQPPLYYAIVAASTFWIDSSNLGQLLQRNPHWLFTEVRALINDNQNLVLHGPMDSFPYRRAALAVHIGRWWSLAFGVVTVSCTFFIGRRLFPGHLPPVLTATALVALTPQFIRVSATVSNDSLSAALASLAVLLALKFTDPTRDGLARPGPVRFGDRHALLLGLLAGLALLAKLSSLTVFWLVVVILFWRLFFTGELHEAPLQKLGRWLLILILTTAVMTGWWFFRNYRLYGEWLATDIHLNLAGRSPLSPGDVWHLRQEAERAYWATFGWGQIRPPEWVYQLLFWFSRIGLAGLVVAVLAKIFQGEKSWPLPVSWLGASLGQVGLLCLWAGLNLVLYLRWVMEVGSVSHTRLVFPAITAISLLLALGWHAFLPRRLAGWFSGLVIFLLLALNLYSLGGLIYPAFTPPPLLEAGEQEPAYGEPPVQTGLPVNDLSQANQLDLTFLNSLKLVEGQVQVDSQGLAVQGDVIEASVLWQTVAPMDRNYSVAAVLLAPDGRVLARRETYPGLGLRPTAYLRPGDSFRDVYPLRLASDVDQPVVARVTVNLFDVASDTRAGFPALDPAGREVTPVIGQVKIAPVEWPEYRPAVTARVEFAGAIALIGYDLNLPASDNEAAGKITFYWQSLAQVTEDYTLFLHLLDAAGEVLAQADAPPTANDYPTRWWSPGEIVADIHTLTIPPGMAALRFGFYEPASGQRLPVVASTLPAQADSVEIKRP